MARLFVFAIGGTGSRVLRALTLLLAAGVKPKKGSEFEIVPIIIDPHEASYDLMRTENILTDYQKVVQQVGTGNGFFGTPINTIRNLMPDASITNNFKFSLEDIKDKTFREYIGFDSMSPASQALAGILFSGKSIGRNKESIDLIDIPMEIGFVGNPNVGSVVLNQIKDSTEFRAFTDIFDQNDRIFIISSIFGGTGAAGFPVLVKNIRNAANNENAVPNAGFLRDATIGAITVLPYFNLESNDLSPIQRADFIAKTRDALHYYKDNITGNNSVNALYYLADDFAGKPYKNDPGVGGQQNNAHFIELAAALSIIDFMEIPTGNLSCSNGQAVNPIYREYGIVANNDPVSYTHLANWSMSKLSIRLSQFWLLTRYMKDEIAQTIGSHDWCHDEPNISKDYLDSTFYEVVKNMSEAFEDWLTEMGDNSRAFGPINLSAALGSSFNNIPERALKMWKFEKSLNYTHFNSELNAASLKKGFASIDHKFLTMFFAATEILLKDRFAYFKNIIN